MKKEDLMLLLLVIILILAAIITIFFGGERSRHGTGALFPEPTLTLDPANPLRHLPA